MSYSVSVAKIMKIGWQ